MTLRVRRVMASMVALAVVASGCGTDEAVIDADDASAEDAAAPDDEDGDGADDADDAVDLDVGDAPEEDVGLELEDGSGSEGGCDELAELFVLWEAVGMAMFASPEALLEAAETFVRELPGAAERAAAGAPPEIADDLETVLTALDGMRQDLAGAGDADAVFDSIFDAIEADDGEAVDAAFLRLEDYASEQCNGAGDGAAGAAALPDPCGLADPAAVAAAAGIAGVWEAGRAANTFEMPGLSSTQCVYDGDGVTLTIEVIGYADIDTARGMYADNAHVVVEGVDLAGLPGSTLLTETEGSPKLQAIYVFEAPAPFGIQFFPDVTDHAGLVSAAEVVLAGQ